MKTNIFNTKLKVIKTEKPLRNVVRQGARLCSDCANYVKSRKWCKVPGIEKVKNPNVYYCSWWKGILNAK